MLETLHKLISTRSKSMLCYEFIFKEFIFKEFIFKEFIFKEFIFKEFIFKINFEKYLQSKNNLNSENLIDRSVSLFHTAQASYSI